MRTSHYAYNNAPFEEYLLSHENIFMEEKVIHVNTKNREVGAIEKLEAHKKGLLHRAFSIVIFNSKGEMLLQKRNKKKYHSGGLWTNSCCGHPRPGEDILDAGKRRLFEEMGISKLPLRQEYVFHYKTKLSKDLAENEIDHVLVGKKDNIQVKPDRKEVEDWLWVGREELSEDLNKNPEKYTYWFRKIIKNDMLTRYTANETRA